MLSLPAALVAMAITGSGPGETVLLDFYADWCGPCQSMMPTVDQLARQGQPVRRVNVDKNRKLASRFHIESIPCFVMIVNGKEAGRVVGPTSLGRLQQLCSLGRVAAPAPNAMLAVQPQAPPAAPDWARSPDPARLSQAPPAQPAFSIAPAGNQAPNGSPTFVPVSFTPPSQPQPVSDAAMLAASVRIRVEDPQGPSPNRRSYDCGSGTIIDATAGGEALVLTCGHLFRDSKGQGKIEIDVYGPAPASHLAGRLIGYDLDRDVGLIAFRPSGPVMVARVARPGYTLRPGDAVASVGCNKGDDPTVQHNHVNSVDRYSDPAAGAPGTPGRDGIPAGEPHAPWNLQVSGQPVVGRSGGGLFSSEGVVVGVCNAAMPGEPEGLFAATGSIYAVLDQQRLGSLYKQAIALPALVPPMETAPAGLIASDPFAAGRAASPRAETASQLSGQPSSLFGGATTATNAAPRTAASEASQPGGDRTASPKPDPIDEIRRRLDGGSEIVCVIRDPSNPQAQSEVITLNHTSAAMDSQAPIAQAPGVRRAFHEPPAPGDPQPIPTSTKRPMPILEWDISSGWKHRHPLPNP
jgi:thiol-disulfide isomerase/thioredoxin